MSLTGIATWNSALLPMDEVLSVSNSTSSMNPSFSPFIMFITSFSRSSDKLYIKQVSPDSPAMQAGIQVGDVLTKIDSKEILTAEQYEDCILNAKDGQQSTVTVKRMGADGKYQDLRFKVVFGTLQEN